MGHLLGGVQGRTRPFEEIRIPSRGEFEGPEPDVKAAAVRVTARDHNNPIKRPRRDAFGNWVIRKLGA